MLNRAARGVERYVRSAPGTYLWLLILLITTAILKHVSPRTEHWILERRSTNIHYLLEDPVRVLIQSALYIDGGSWLFYLALYTLFHAQAERWLGTWRWLAIAFTCHVLATYVSQGVLAWAIHNNSVSGRMRFTLDYGVSYALAGIVAVLAYWWPRGWMRWVYAGCVLVFYGVAMVRGRTFTDVGHFTAVLVGLGCYPLVRAQASPMARGWRWWGLVATPPFGSVGSAEEAAAGTRWGAGRR